MSDGIRTESLRYDQAKIQLESQHERDVRELKEKHRNELERVLEHQQALRADTDKAFEITLSATRDEQDKKITELRQTYAKLIEDEKLKGEDEIDRVKARYQEQISRYRQNNEKQLEEMRRQNDVATDNIKRSRDKGKA